MAHALRLSAPPALAAQLAEIARAAVVLASALSLILAGKALPF